jgi:hypothetical protein
VSGGCCECEHEVRDCTCPGVQYPKSAGIEAKLCNEEGVVGEGGDSDGVGDESGNNVVGCRCKWSSPFQSVQSGGGSSVL